MTLVVARHSPRGPRLVSDTRLVRPLIPRRHDLFGGQIKLVLAHRNLCVGVAGTIDYALDAVRRLAIRADMPLDVDYVIAALLRAHNERAVQFIVATLDPAVLVVIRDGRAITVTEATAWIGDPAAYAVFRRHDMVDEDAGPDWSDPTLHSAMEETIEAGLDMVGGFLVSVGPTSKGFIYAPRGLLMSAPGAQRTPPRQWTTIEFGQGAARGSYSEQILSPREPGIPMLAFHISEAHAGALYLPLHLPGPVVVRGGDANALGRFVRERFAVELTGSMIGSRRADRLAS